MDTMDSATATIVHNYHASVSHFHYYRAVPHSINYSQSREPSSLPLLAVPEGAICINNRVVFEPPKPGQLIRMIEVEGVTKLWICDEEVRGLYDRIRSYLNQSEALSTDPLLESSTVLQHIFLSPEPKCQHVYEALMVAQNEVSSYLFGKLQSFEGKETELRDDMTSTGPGPMLRSFISYTLAYLQRLPAETSVRGQTEPAPRHVCEVREWGIRFDLSGSFKSARYIEARWSEFSPLHNVGIWFSESYLPSLPWRCWFSAPGSLDPNVREEGSLTDGVLVERLKEVAQQAQ